MSNERLYQVLVMGKPDDRLASIRSLLESRLRDLGLTADSVSFELEGSFEVDSRLPRLAIFFGYQGASDSAHPAISGLIEDSTPIITVVSDLQKVTVEIPPVLTHINALAVKQPDTNLDRAVSLILEQFRLLRRERRLFISYKRTDSQKVADQLYEALEGKGFDVFLDTRSVPPGVDFQAELWHRMSDSDVVVLIDTPGFRDSRWTTEELARANATNIQILHLLWPGQEGDETSSLSHFFDLLTADFIDADLESAQRSISPNAVDGICRSAERLRARAIAARHRYLVDSFCDAARDVGLSPIVQPQFWISVQGKKGTVAAVPTIGVPTSERLHTIFDTIPTNDGKVSTWVLYDGRGILSSWIQHLSWLDGYLPVKSVAMVNVTSALKALSA